jgi:hypothetical protein
MPRKCLVCESQHLKEIDKSLVDNESNRSIAKRFALSPAAVQRHKTNHLPKALVKAKQAGEIVEATSLMDRVERIMVRCELIAEQATKGKDWLPAIAASRELRSCLELLGKLSGEIQNGVRVGIAINGAGKTVVIGSPEWQSSFGDFLEWLDADDDMAQAHLPPGSPCVGLKLTQKFMDGLLDD